MAKCSRCKRDCIDGRYVIVDNKPVCFDCTLSGTGKNKDYSVSGDNAGLWLRLIAFLVDQIVLVGIAFVVASTLGAILIVSGNELFLGSSQGELAANIVGFLISLFYYALMESSSKQATLGKMALGLKVVDLQGNRLSFGRAFGRHLAKILSGLTLGIGYLMIAFTEKKQGLHDLIAGCLVVKR